MGPSEAASLCSTHKPPHLLHEATADFHKAKTALDKYFNSCVVFFHIHQANKQKKIPSGEIPDDPLVLE